LAAIGACTLLAFSVFLFPLIIAATPENRGLETIETEDPYPQEELGQPDEHEPDMQDTDSITQQEIDDINKNVHEEFMRQQNSNSAEEIDINAITKEMALEIVEGLYSIEAIEIYPGKYINSDPAGDVVHIVSRRPLGARYVSAPDSTVAPVWQVFIHEQLQGTIHYRIPEGHTAESYLAEFQNYRASQFYGCCYTYSIFTRSTGTTVIQSESSIETITMIELDAFTGKELGSGWFTFCKHNTNYSQFVESEDPDWEFITDYMEYNVSLPGSDGQPYQRFDYHLTPEPTPMPSPDPRP